MLYYQDNLPTPAFLLSLLSFVVHQEAKRREMSRKEEKKSHLETMIGGSKIKLYLTGGILGCLRSIVGFPFEHPLDSMKTQWQTQPHMKNEYYIFREIWQKKGFLGLYAGSIPNLSRNIVKNTVRYPSIIAFEQLYELLFPQTLKYRRNFVRILTGVSVSWADIGLLCPFERLKVVFMTKSASHKLTYLQVLKQFRHQGAGIKELYRGFWPYFVRQNITWAIFLQLDLLCKQKARKSLNIKKEEEIPILEVLWRVSFPVSFTNTILGMPFDVIKTYLQKHDPSGKISKAAKIIWKQNGWKGFFIGWRLRFIMYFSHAAFACTFIEKLEWIGKIG